MMAEAERTGAGVGAGGGAGAKGGKEEKSKGRRGKKKAPSVDILLLGGSKAGKSLLRRHLDCTWTWTWTCVCVCVCCLLATLASSRDMMPCVCVYHRLRSRHQTHRHGDNCYSTCLWRVCKVESSLL